MARYSIGRIEGCRGVRMATIADEGAARGTVVRVRVDHDFATLACDVGDPCRLRPRERPAAPGTA
jgi:hypothetical protein